MNRQCRKEIWTETDRIQTWNGSNLFGPFWTTLDPNDPKTWSSEPGSKNGPENGPKMDRKIIYLMDDEVWFLNRVVIWDIVLIFHFLIVSQLSQFCLVGCLFCLTGSLKMELKRTEMMRNYFDDFIGHIHIGETDYFQ